MVTYDLNLGEGTPKLYLNIPLGDYLIDAEKVKAAKQIIENADKMIGSSTELYINNESATERERYNLNELVERYRSLYLLSLIERMLDKVRPLKDPYIASIDEKIQPEIARVKKELNREKGFLSREYVY